MLASLLTWRWSLSECIGLVVAQFCGESFVSFLVVVLGPPLLVFVEAVSAVGIAVIF